MPQMRVYRQWCTTCADWSLFKINFGEDKKCSVCGTVHVETLLSDIPDDKINEQQTRYRAKKRAEFNSVLNIYSSLGLSSSSYSHIIESDAGYEHEMRLLSEKREKERNLALQDIAAHKHLGRNEKCLCDSGKKYKQCCLIRIRNYNV